MFERLRSVGLKGFTRDVTHSSLSFRKMTPVLCGAGETGDKNWSRGKVPGSGRPSEVLSKPKKVAEERERSGRIPRGGRWVRQDFTGTRCGLRGGGDWSTALVSGVSTQ